MVRHSFLIVLLAAVSLLTTEGADVLNTVVIGAETSHRRNVAG